MGKKEKQLLAEKDKLCSEKDGAGKKEKQLLEQLLAEKDKLCSEKDDAGKKEKQRVEQLLAEKDKRIERLTCDVEDLNRECAEKVARYCAVLANRIVVDEGLRRLYPRLNTFTNRYDRFLREHILEGRTRLSRRAVEIEKRAPPYAGVERGDLVKEVKCFAHNSSKVFHYLGMEHGAGIYCGGEPLVLASVTILIALLQSQGCLSGLVDIVDRTGKVVLKVEGGVLTKQI